MAMSIRNNNIQQTMLRTFSASNQLRAMQVRNIASGYRINSAADDASGLAIAKKMTAQISGLSTASQNSQDAVSMLQTAEGALEQVNSITVRMSELAVRASNGILGQSERQMLQAEYNQLAGEIDRIGQSSTFNGKPLFDGTDYTMQVGPTSQETMDIEIGTLSSKSLGLDKVDLTTSGGANSALKSIADAISSVSSQRAGIGAAENTLRHTINSLDNTGENLQSSLSRIMDADFGKESINRSISMALNATSLAMMKNSQHMMQYSVVSMLMR